MNAFGKWKSRRSHRIWRKPHQKCCDQTDETKEWCDDFFCPTLRTSQAVGHFKSLAKVPSQATCSGRVLKLCKPKSLKIAFELFHKLCSFEVFTYSGKPVYSRYGEEDCMDCMDCMELNTAFRKKAGAKVAP